MVGFFRSRLRRHPAGRECFRCVFPRLPGVPAVIERFLPAVLHPLRQQSGACVQTRRLSISLIDTGKKRTSLNSTSLKNLRLRNSRGVKNQTAAHNKSHNTHHRWLACTCSPSTRSCLQLLQTWLTGVLRNAGRTEQQKHTPMRATASHTHH